MHGVKVLANDVDYVVVSFLNAEARATFEVFLLRIKISTTSAFPDGTFPNKVNVHTVTKHSSVDMIVDRSIGGGGIDAEPLERMVLGEGEFGLEFQIIKDAAEIGLKFPRVRWVGFPIRFRFCPGNERLDESHLEGLRVGEHRSAGLGGYGRGEDRADFLFHVHSPQF
jgi:hypothetical protein